MGNDLRCVRVMYDQTRIQAEDPKLYLDVKRREPLLHWWDCSAQKYLCANVFYSMRLIVETSDRVEKN